MLVLVLVEVLVMLFPSYCRCLLISPSHCAELSKPSASYVNPSFSLLATPFSFLASSFPFVTSSIHLASHSFSSFVISSFSFGVNGRPSRGGTDPYISIQ